MILSLNHLCCPSLNFLHCAFTWELATGVSPPAVCHWYWTEGKKHQFWPPGEAKLLWAIFDVRAHCWLTVSFSARTVRSHLAKLLPCDLAPSLYWDLVFLHKNRTLHFLLVAFHVFCPFLSLSRFLLIAAQLSEVSTASDFALSVNLLKGHSVPPCNLLMEVLNNIGSPIDPWGVSLMTGLQLDLVLLIYSALSSTLWTVFIIDHSWF